MQLKKLVLNFFTPCSIKVAQYSIELAQCSTKVAQYSTKVGIKIFSSKHIHAGSSFKDLVAKNPRVKTDLKSDAQFKRYGFLKIQKTEIIAREPVSFEERI